MKIVNLDNLKIEGSFKVPLHTDDELLSSGVFNPNGINFALGSSLGKVYFGSIREDA